MLNKINTCKPNKIRHTPKRLNSARTSPFRPFLSKYKPLRFLRFFSFVLSSLMEIVGIPYPIEIAPYGYSTVSLCSFLPAAVRMVSGPTLPINIKKINISLPAMLNCAVMPVESPTVAKAETVSNAIGKNGSVSVIVNTNTAAETIQVLPFT